LIAPFLNNSEFMFDFVFVYLLFGPLSVHFRSLGERVFKPFSQTRYKMIIAK